MFEFIKRKNTVLNFIKIIGLGLLTFVLVFLMVKIFFSLNNIEIGGIEDFFRKDSIEIILLTLVAFLIPLLGLSLHPVDRSRVLNIVTHAFNFIILAILTITLISLFWILIYPKLDTVKPSNSSSNGSTNNLTLTKDSLKISQDSSMNLIMQKFNRYEKGHNKTLTSFEVRADNLVSLLQVMVAIFAISGGVLFFIIRKKINDL